MEYLYETAQQSWDAWNREQKAELEIDWDQIDFETMEACERSEHCVKARNLAAMLGISPILAERWLDEAEEER